MSASLSLVVPSGHLTLGNLLGAVLRWTTDQHQVGGLYGVADLHALTLEHDPAQVRALTLEQVGVLLAAGLEPQRCTIFVQSQVSAHTELLWLLESTVHVGELQRMVQFKQKAAGRGAVRASLLTYPALMAADILLYGAEEVPVGDDQRQHLELARAIAQRFNTSYGETFVVPRAATPAVAARVMDLQRPREKMSKSAREDRGVIRVLDPPEVVRRKIARAVTDADALVRHDPERKPGVSNLLEILSACTPAHPPTPSPGSSAPTGDSRSPSPTPSWSCSRPCSIATPRSRPILDTSRACCTTARPLPARLPHRPWPERKRRLACYRPHKGEPASPARDTTHGWADQGATNAGQVVGGTRYRRP
jgi:tryptophanyl-tRNA synthetase